jgi:hypothetical protein
MIPKIIWQTHQNKYNDLLPFQKDITNTWKNLNPEWEYRYVDAEERSLAVKEYSEILHKYYLLSDNLHQSDIWRLVAVYQNGGFYADMDSICIMSIEESLEGQYNNEELVCSPIGFQHYGINSSNFGSIKNSKIIKSIIDSLFVTYNEVEDVSSFGFGFPENYTFSNIAEKNQDVVFFNNKYFSHAMEYKTSFNSNVDVIFNKEKINYQSLCVNMNWPIYYI